LHVFVALAMEYLPGFSTLHALAVLGACLAIGAAGRTQVALNLAAYVAGCEVLWRMSDANIPWESGKYFTMATLGLVLLRKAKAPSLMAILYIAPLLVSIPLTIAAAPSLNEARKMVLFNLSGPLALFVVLWFFSGAAPRVIDRWQMFVVAIGPIVGTAGVATFTLSRASDVSFVAASNVIAAGGYGPNQVASVLSLGIVLSFVLVVVARGKVQLRLLFAAVFAYLFLQAGLTLSRSGLAMALGGIVVIALHFVRSPRTRIGIAVAGAAMVAITNFVLVPLLESYTGGAFMERFTETGLSRREDIAKTDVQIFKENPITGVGPGVAAQIRMQYLGLAYGSHTEFSRVLAEHGILGVLSLLAMGGGLLTIYFRVPDVGSKGIAGALMMWAMLYQSVNGFRLVSPAFAVLLAAAFMSAQAAPRVAGIRGALPVQRSAFSRSPAQGMRRH